MTYNVFGGTLSHPQSINQSAKIWSHYFLWDFGYNSGVREFSLRTLTLALKKPGLLLRAHNRNRTLGLTV